MMTIFRKALTALAIGDEELARDPVRRIIQKELKMLYCIKHGKMVHAEKAGLCPSGHIVDDRVEVEPGLYVHEIDFCCFDDGWATCPPPEYSETFPPEPDNDEMDRINLGAEELKHDLGAYYA